jgi:hypothetical protein
MDRPEDARRRTAAGTAMVKARFDSRRAFDRLARLLAQPICSAARPTGTK